MMFFVMMKRQSSIDTIYSKKDLEMKRNMLLEMQENGILERAYIKIEGGFIYILNADSFSDIRNAFRDSRISLEYECNIYEIDQKTNIPVE